MPSVPESQDFPYEVSACLGQVLRTDIIVSSVIPSHTSAIHSSGFGLGRECATGLGSRRVCDYRDHSLTPLNFFYSSPEQIHSGFLAV